MTAITIGPADRSAAPRGKVPSQSDATQRSGVSQHTTEEEDEIIRRDNFTSNQQETHISSHQEYKPATLKCDYFLC